MKRRLWGLYNTQVRGRARVRASARPSVRASEDADRTYVKRDPIIIWQSVVAFAPRGPEGAERYQNSPVITSESLAKVAALAADWTNCFQSFQLFN